MTEHGRTPWLPILVLALLLVLVVVLVPKQLSVPVTAVIAETFAPPVPTATVIFGGDMMFDRAVRTLVARNEPDFIFGCIANTLATADHVVANLEGPITSLPSVSVGTTPESPNNFRFTFPIETAARIAPYVDTVAVGNNHALDWGFAGLAENITHLEKAGVSYFGDAQSHTVHEEDIGGVPLSFIGYNEFDPVWWTEAQQKTIEQVIQARGSGRVPVVYTHWGDEYVPATDRVKATGRSFIEAGAAMVIGSHPHVVQEHEYWQGKPIYYSLGNLIFDQYFSEEVQNGLLISVTFTKDGVQDITEIPIVIGTDRRPCLSTPGNPGE